jgi:hypothetical protein
MKNAILRVSQKINGKWIVKKTPVDSVEQAIQLVRGLTITEFTSVIQDDTGFLFEIMPNGRVKTL